MEEMKRKIETNNEILFKIFGVNIHTYIVLFLYQNQDFFGTLSDIAHILNLSHASVRRVISDLIQVSILEKFEIGPSIVVRFNSEGLFTKPLLEFLEKIHYPEEIEEEKIDKIDLRALRRNE